MEPDHYRRLGVAPSASTEEIRVAYRALAGRLHPDRAAGGTAAEQALAERRMREVNESWHVLQDPARRRRYDDGRSGRMASTAGRDAPAGAPSPARRTTGADDDDLVDVLPEMGLVTAGVFRHLPWVVLLVLLGGIFIVSAYAGTHDAATEEPQVRPGSCIDVSNGPSTTIVSCTGPHELVVVTRVLATEGCPQGTERRRFGTDELVDCVK